MSPNYNSLNIYNTIRILVEVYVGEYLKSELEKIRVTDQVEKAFSF